MTTKELQIGDWVTDDNGMPMFVQAIYGDDTVYLDFEGNEADTWETDIKDVKPIPITHKILDKNGFRDMWMTKGNVLEIGRTFINYDLNNGYIFIIRNSEDVFDAHKIRFVHQLQHVLRMCEIDKEIVL